MRLPSACLIAGLASVAVTSPVPSTDNASNNAGSDILGVLSTVVGDLAGTNPYLSQKAAVIKSKVQQYQSVQQTANSSSVESALSAIASIFQQQPPPDLAQAVEDLLSQGLLTNVLLDLLNGSPNYPLNSETNNNPKDPATPIYPSKSSDDAPYSVDEASLRSAIYIPESFSYGADGKIPVVLVPGTFIPAGITYQFSFSKLGNATNVDPVWVNIPGASLADAQVNAEYVAYTINYISAVSSSPVAVISWSQGGLDAQWALKYWPSTRAAVTDFIPISPDFHGTVVAYLVCPGFPDLTCTPSVVQQEYTSKFVATLRADGGDSAYVPTTTLYSSFDEIVEPMTGTGASAYLHDARNVGVTNAWIQDLCPGQPAGGVYTHEGMLYNPLSWALAVDAITHDGPADVSRIDRQAVCAQLLPPELDLFDLLGTEGLLLIAVVGLVGYGSFTSQEPPIMAYAQ
jgi:hypothetical protein